MIPPKGDDLDLTEEKRAHRCRGRRGQSGSQGRERGRQAGSAAQARRYLDGVCLEGMNE
jgi:hypothetical protein